MVAFKRYLWEKSPGVWYVRRKGRYHRITAAHGTEDFDRQYWSILKGNTPARTSWGALIDAFRASDRWRELKPRTRADYDKCFDYIRAQNGDRDVARFTARDVAKMLDANAHRVRFGNYVASVLSVLCEFARVDLGWLRDNPAKGVRKRRVPVERRKPHPVPDDATVAKMRAEALPLPRLIFELGIGMDAGDDRARQQISARSDQPEPRGNRQRDQRRKARAHQPCQVRRQRRSGIARGRAEVGRDHA